MPAVCRIRNLVPRLIATSSDRRWRAGGQHHLHRIMRGTPLKASLADLRNFAQGHGRQFNAQVNDQLAHIWRQALRRLLWLFSRLGGEKADHALFIKSVGFALQGRTWLSCFFCSLSSWIAEKYDRSQQFICCLFRPERVLLDGLPVFGMLSLNPLAFGHRAPSNTMKWADASIVPGFFPICKPTDIFCSLCTDHICQRMLRRGVERSEASVRGFARDASLALSMTGWRSA